ncbi:hypothetical protein BUZ01_05255 [Staphylococcus gallinarum]|uniref:Uncharacterized protein n=1 Tax=Staphylococcus gallinarum TaxID=1293 RepID=A0A418HR58_STAGA|nr:hypothetical protein BUY96_00440 [Staphylococcus gallinarum]RIL44041.1 hypothetical protein BUZ01_05255 [Staphylococcus gallinarum]RIO88970.1 hypothetical protein BUZ04_12900 [Staphylococcus gallinarum]
MSVETEARPIPLGKRAITIRSIDINNKLIKGQKFLMGLMLGLCVPDYFLLIDESVLQVLISALVLN